MGKKNCGDTHSYSFQGRSAKRQTGLFSDLATSLSRGDHARRERLSRIWREIHCSLAGLPGYEFATNRDGYWRLIVTSKPRSTSISSDIILCNRFTLIPFSRPRRVKAILD